MDPANRKNPRDASRYSSGVNLYRIPAIEFTETKKMLLVKKELLNLKSRCIGINK